MTNVIFFNLWLLVICGYAVIRGGAPERLVAIFLAVAAATTFVVQRQASLVFHEVEIDILLIDVALLIALAVVALRADRFWPLWMIGFHGLTLMVHAAKAYEPNLVPLIYGLAVGKLAYPMLAILAVATWRHRRRLALHGADSSWATFSARSTPA